MDANYLPEVGAVLAEIGVFEWPLATAVTSPGTVAETAIGVIGPGPANIAIGTISIHPAAALTANGTNFVTVTVAKRTSGGAAVTLATLATSTTSWVAWTAINMAVVAGAFVSPGDAITVKVVATASGVGVPQLVLVGYTTIN